MRKRIGHFTPTIISLATAYDDQSGAGDELVIPESFEGMEYAALGELYATAQEQFDALYAEYADTMTDEQVATLASLTQGIEALAAELSARDAETAQRTEAAAELASRVQALRAQGTEDGADNADAEDADGEDADEDEEGGEDADADGDDDAESAAQTVVASGATRQAVRVPMSSVRRQNPTPPAATTPTMRDVAFAASEGQGINTGDGVDFLGIGRIIDRQLASASSMSAQYATAAKQGRAISQQHAVATFSRQIPSDLTISSTDREHVDAVISRAIDESRLPGGALVAAGGWCAPSETLYDLLELESRDGMLSLPEVGVARGGINFTTGPSFADIYSQITGFAFTEEDDIDGKYEPGVDGNVVGPKPCFHIECPDFSEVRLEVAGLCLTAGLLQQRGYPEVIARTVRGALVAHEHRVNAAMISRMVAGSTAVNLPTPQAGATAPILTGIELQVEHYRYTHRLSRSTTLEAVFPFWVRGAIRSDLSRRLGVELLEVGDQRIVQWFRDRGINPQFVYNWQALDTVGAAAFTAWPTQVDFLLYAAGTWVRGSSDIITLDTLYDSTLLANNDFTALFTEEGWLVAKRGFDSRRVRVPISTDGATHRGIEIEHNGTVGVAPVVPGSSEDAPLFTSEVTP